MTEECDEQKKILRKKMKLARSMAKNELALLSRMASENMLKQPQWQGASRIALYYPLPGEADCRYLINAAFGAGKKVFLPVIVDAGKRLMEFVEYKGGAELKKGSMGILEPLGEIASRPVFDLAVIPGLAFDICGGRLGYGGGYYDRYFGAASSVPVLAGFCLDCQIVDKVPSTARDIAMNMVCSEKSAYCVGSV